MKVRNPSFRLWILLTLAMWVAGWYWPPLVAGQWREYLIAVPFITLFVVATLDRYWRL